MYKQLRRLYNPDFNLQNEVEGWFVEQVQSTVADTFKSICVHIKEHPEHPVFPANEPYVELLSKAYRDKFDANGNMLMAMEQLWEDPHFKRILSEKSSKNPIWFELEYWMPRLHAISRPGYVPTVEDYVQLRFNTTGILHSVIQIGGKNWDLSDIGGLRNQRRRWIHLYQNVAVGEKWALLFFVSLTSYCELAWEDERTNRLCESLETFEEVLKGVKSQKTEEAQMFLIFTKADLLRNKLRTNPLRSYFADFNGSNDYNSVVEFIVGMFQNKAKEHCSSPLLHFVINSTNQHEVKTTFEVIMSAITDPMLQLEVKA
eukprot:TRINITY_DN9412_c0_g1_i1.p1 TRINITY_DN9412_c0_g1~~TRINITY_DN9412_c0_g1_i1.p1  ORF type:complete len:316 (-),score=86.59 TRINITY_DN9412_c0_g1_i1:127-1074(-)